MKKYLLLFATLFLYNIALGAPSNTMSISPVAVDGATITASDENARNNIIVSTYNAHTHTDISQVANTLNVGDALVGDKTINVYNADTNKPYLKYDDTNNYWIFSTDGVAPSIVLQGTGIIFEGTTDNTYETTLSITDPTADRTITIPNDTGTIILSGASSAQTIDLSGDTISDLGTVTTTDIDGGTIDGVTIGGASAGAITCTTLTTGGKLTAGANEIEGSNIDITGGTMSGVNIGGTTATGELLVNDANDDADGLGSQGTSGQVLQSAGAGANPTWGNDVNTSNVIFEWLGAYSYVATGAGLFMRTGLNDDLGAVAGSYLYFAVAGTTYRTILTGRFTKIAGISTISIHANIWAIDNVVNNEAILSVDIGGQANTVKSVNSSVPTWVTSSTIDVSSLTNGTTYDITIQLKNEDNLYSYCGGVVLIAS